MRFGIRLEVRIVLAALSLLLSTMTAHAEYLSKTALSGASINIYHAYSVNPDCSSAGQMVVRVTNPPQHGRIVVKNAQVFPFFPEFNPRSVCNRRRVPGVRVFYSSDRGYTGSDAAAIEIFSPSGQTHDVSYSISVR